MEEPIYNAELSGKLTIEFQANKNLDSFCLKNIPNYEIRRYEAIAVRVLAGKEVIITVYAFDKLSHKDLQGNLPVKKFKLSKINPYQLYEFIKGFNFTLSSQKYDLEKIEVTNR